EFAILFRFILFTTPANRRSVQGIATIAVRAFCGMQIAHIGVSNPPQSHSVRIPKSSLSGKPETLDAGTEESIGLWLPAQVGFWKKPLHTRGCARKPFPAEPLSNSFMRQALGIGVCQNDILSTRFPISPWSD